ncbi:MAG: PAS domain S-box protein [Candidatus Lokiarchaeota archaeon]|nr:PAS domain S-box protein [Candidatus Lokiarchaeota archaeon]MBD3341773.1 PAS domain S-box protein [Candidatus Lokiarchaeota archaeon]
MIKLGKDINGLEVDYRDIFNSFPSSIILIHFNRMIIDINSSTKRLFGYYKKELIKKDICKVIKYSESSLKLFEEKLSKLINGKQVNPFDLKAYKKDGTPLWINIEPLSIQIKELPVITLVIQDISNYKSMEFKLEEILKNKNDLVNFASHELKTPLSSVYGACQLLNKFCKDELSEQAKEYLDIALNGGKRLNNLIKNLLDSALIDSNKLSIQMQEEDLVKIASDCVRDYIGLFQQRNIEIIMEFPSKLYANIDRLKIAQVITNLLSNALKYSPSKATIEIKIQKRKNRAQLSIKDSGVGLTKKETNRLFKRFGRIKSSEEIEGTGLGLFISKKIIELHGGKIWVESEGKNKGSTFFFTITIK